MKTDKKCMLLMGSFYAMNCTIISFSAYYLGKLGYKDKITGLVVALACFIGALLQVICGRVADKNPKWYWKNQLIIFAVVGLVLTSMLLFINNLFVSGIIYGILILLILLIMPMTNTACFYYSSRGVPVNFGVVRGVGSVVFAAASFLVGKTTAGWGMKAVPITALFFGIIFLLTVLSMPQASADNRSKRSSDGQPQGSTDSASKGATESSPSDSSDNQPELSAIGTTEIKKELSSENNKGFVRKYPVFIVMAVSITLVLVLHNMVNIYLIRIVERVGGDSGSLGTALGIAAIAEIPVLFLYSKVAGKKEKSAATFILIACAFFVLRGVLYIFATNIIMIYFVQLLQSVSYGLIIAAKASYADQVVEREDETTGQSVMTVTDAMSTVSGSLLGGILVDNGGVILMLWVGVAMALCGTVVAFLAGRRN